MSERELAKELIVEIVRCADGIFDGKTRLFKVFYFAHLLYAKRFAGYLSDWPIVRMPHGPGIESADSLIAELIHDGVIESRDVTIGPYPSVEYRLSRDRLPQLSLDQIESIRDAVKFAQDKTASELSALTHEYSHSWKNAADGEELNIYVDLLTESEYHRKLAKLRKNHEQLRAVAVAS